MVLPVLAEIRRRGVVVLNLMRGMVIPIQIYHASSRMPSLACRV